jgi:hypothetical protein
VNGMPAAYREAMENAFNGRAENTHTQHMITATAVSASYPAAHNNGVRIGHKTPASPRRYIEPPAAKNAMRDRDHPPSRPLSRVMARLMPASRLPGPHTDKSTGIKGTNSATSIALWYSAGGVIEPAIGARMTLKKPCGLASVRCPPRARLLASKLRWGEWHSLTGSPMSAQQSRSARTRWV